MKNLTSKTHGSRQRAKELDSSCCAYFTVKNALRIRLEKEDARSMANGQWSMADGQLSMMTQG